MEEMYEYMLNNITATNLELMGRYNIGHIEDNKIIESYNKYYISESSFANLEKVKEMEEKLKDKVLKYIPDDNNNGNINNDHKSNHGTTKYFKRNSNKNKHQ